MMREMIKSKCRIRGYAIEVELLQTIKIEPETR